jgi:formylglycine-generating enzyme required for sulfatase activity
VARGPNSARYPWGDGPPLDYSRANYELTVGHPSPVGLFPEGNNAEGVCDLLGNVFEWCGDWYGEYAEGPQSNPVGPREGEYRVLRGGACVNYPQYVRVSGRFRNGPTFRLNFIGFRCAGELR